MKIKILFGIFAAVFLCFPLPAEEEAKVAETAEVAKAAETAEAAAADESEPAQAADKKTDAAESAEVEPVQEIAEAVVKAREAAAPKRQPAAAARVSMLAAGLRSSSSHATPAPVTIAPTAAPIIPDEEIECNIGEYPKKGKCELCEQKNNPGVRWENQGKDCKISSCISDEYVLIDKDKEHPKCVQKCAVWGGAASREWSRDNAEFSFCGSGKFLECETGFAPSREQTGSSGTEAGHCVLEGTMTGKCNAEGQTKTGKFANGQCLQVCENGYWTGCTLQRFCEKGFHEDNYKDVILVKDKKDSKASSFDCVMD